MITRNWHGALELSLLGLGCNNFGRRLDYEQSQAVIDAALDVGVNHFDTADVYGDGRSETFLGSALRGRRDQVVVSTKVGIRRDAPHGGGGSRAHIVRACEDSLRRLGTDYIDVYYLHKPDPATPLQETVAAMSSLADAGKIRHVACSNYSLSQLVQLRHLTDGAGSTSLGGVQVGLSLLDRTAQTDLLPACRELGLGTVVFSALGSGLLTGKYSAGHFPEGSRLREMPEFADVATPTHMAVARSVAIMAKERGVSAAALAFAWVTAQPGVTSVLAGATSPQQVQRNATDINAIIDGRDLHALDNLTTPLEEAK